MKPADIDLWEHRVTGAFVVVLALILAWGLINMFTVPLLALLSAGPATTSTPPALECRSLVLPDKKQVVDLCTLPDGTQCLFSRSGQPTVCYTVSQEDDR
jgi:hypothetical protein